MSRYSEIEKRVDKLGSRLYHYTSLNAFYSIMKSKEFWYANAASMNDRSDCVDFINKLERALEEDLSPKYQLKRQEFFKDIRLRLSNEYPHVMRFSGLRDNAAQWERYGDAARGICLVVNTEKFIDITIDNCLHTDKIIYEYDIRNHDHFKWLKPYLEGQSLAYPFKREIDLMDNILVCGYFHKHKSFCTEEEIRSAPYYTFDSDYANSDYVVLGGRVRSVLKINIDKLCENMNMTFEDLFDEIIIGPLSNQTNCELISFLRDCGFDDLANKVITSECPLR